MYQNTLNYLAIRNFVVLRRLILNKSPVRMIDLKVYNNVSPEKGKVLITEPFLEDDYFERSIVLICEHNDEGSFGFVLTNDSELILSDILDVENGESKIYVGGPVGKEHLYFIHSLGNEIDDSIHIIGDLYMGGDFEQIKSKIALGLIDDSKIKFFVGYSGWVKNQLEGELKQNAWLVSDIIDEAALLNDDSKTLWATYMKNKGGKYKAFAQFPTDHKLN